jgi:hypothetical protein
MHRPPRFPEGSRQKLLAALRKARTKGQYRLVLCLWLREVLAMNSQQVALALDMSPSGVKNVWWHYRQKGEALFKEQGRGGRRRQNLSVKAERDFLDDLISQSMPGKRVMDTRFIQQAYETHLGRRVTVSVIYRLLKRHDWRPVDRTQFRMPRGWEPYAHSLREDLPDVPYEIWRPGQLH